jgi:hypothetical protein
LVNKFDETASNIQPHSFSCIQPHSPLSAAKECGTNLDQTFFKSLFKICLAASLQTSRHSESSLVVIRTVLHHNGMSSLHTFIGPSGNWPVWAKIILQRLGYTRIHV